MGTTQTDDIIKLYANDQRIDRLRQFASSNVHQLNVGGVQASMTAVAIAATGFKRNLIICPEKDDAPYIYHDLTRLLGTERVFFLPSSFKHQPTPENYDAQNIQLRIESLSHLLSDDSVYVVTYPSALCEKVMSAQRFSQHIFEVEKGAQLSISFLCEVLMEYGFNRVDFVYEPGQYSVRGSIVDVFSYADDEPQRIDFFGDEVDSIRSFELESQLSTGSHDKIAIVPDIEHNDDSGEMMPLSQVIGEDCMVWTVAHHLTTDLMNDYVETIVDLKADDGQKVLRSQFCSGNEWNELLASKMINFTNRSTDNPSINFDCVPQPLFKKNFDMLEDDIYYKNADGYDVYILSDNSRQVERLRDILSQRKRKIKYRELRTILHQGFVDREARRCFYTDHQIFERFHKYTLRNESTRGAQQQITLRELSQLNVGDYVVHVDHGIGVFNGLVTTEANGHKFEAIRLTFREGDTLFVNVQSLHKISKYRGKDGVEPKIDKLGAAHWSKLKERAKSRVKDIARELIALYAQRQEERGFAFSPDSYLQNELEASFFYEDTPDQEKATQMIKADMERDVPMDRLVCGDVGFGKTELAIRAAFKAVCDSKQVAVLVPTTVLAFQHYNTFSARLKGLPCKVEYVSRMRKPSEVRAILKRLEAGDVDIIIGTHRVIGKDVKFKDLGLLIIDEEQRFGVGVKEKLRSLKLNVDTLTLTATPIPRTLQFSLMGARDLSVLTTPPANRQPIETHIETFSEDSIRFAIQNEIERGGQVFIINNRVSHLYELQRIVNNLLPDVRTVVAHGQMDGTELESIMLDFIDGQYDVLLATTIIESGLDIPNANTIIINNAHQFGLSELHQLRGRVGRSNVKAFCYLFAPPLSTLTQEARRRLNIIEDFSDLGSGFNIAMQDLDVRGAGDVLGAEQSGFISDIGYETYQKILNEALIELRQNAPQQVFADGAGGQNDTNLLYVADCQIDTDEELLFPDTYISSISERMKLYKVLDNLNNNEEIEKFRAQLIDRFGPLPEVSEQLLHIVGIRKTAERLGIEKLVFKNKQLLLYFVSDQNSAFYQSATFSNIINWIQQNPKRVKLKELKGKLCLAATLQSMSEVATLLTNIENKQLETCE
ncbi:MAG: transcription-repair coupling factor [Bacteroidales bacterium]|nr:transcription-repair coupling factor [Bacteroidales bacterium]